MNSRHSPSSEAAGGSSPGEWVAIGEIVGSFGVRGEMKVAPLTDFPERFAHTSTVYIGDAHTPYRVSRAQPHKHQQIRLQLAGVDDLTAAERLHGLRLWIPVAELTPLPADQYYLHDLVGLRVRHVNGQDLGVIADVVTAGGNDLFVVRGGAPSGEDVLLPAVKAFIKMVDISAGVIVVDPVPGLFDASFEEAR